MKGWLRALHCARIVGALAVGLGLAGCHLSTPAPPGQLSDSSLTIAGQRQTIELAPVHIATMRLQSPPKPVENGGIANLWAPSAKPADLANNAETQALNFSLAHPDLRIILTVAEGHYRIVARRSAGIKRPADLRGKTIATMAGTSSAYHLHTVLARAGLSEADVTIVSVPTPRDISRTIIDHKVDALAIWEPESQIAANALGDDAILFGGNVAYRELYNLNTTADTLADPAKRAEIVRFVARLIEASRGLRRDPSEAQRLVAGATGYPLGVIQASWTHHRFDARLAPDLLDTLDDEEKWLARLNGRPARSRAMLARLIDPTVVAEARAILSRRGIPGGPAG